MEINITGSISGRVAIRLRNDWTIAKLMRKGIKEAISHTTVTVNDTLYARALELAEPGT
ncbi:hypothetical protein [Burkholderia vietnamiensis]|uniref:hypothetical protein n=1 Tax=Burkholderia vietnamiensis TaxID=60552 RepID=UPI000A6C231F|nr:hypothetical protein [Burkholderia vietnamiensis]